MPPDDEKDEPVEPSAKDVQYLDDVEERPEDPGEMYGEGVEGTFPETGEYREERGTPTGYQYREQEYHGPYETDTGGYGTAYDGRDPYGSPYPSPPGAPPGMVALPHAKGGARILAYIIDALILLVITAPLLIFIVFQAIEEARDSAEEDEPETPNLLLPDFTPLSLGFTMISAVLTLAYFTYFESRTGQTLGKRVMDIKVVKPDLSPITRDDALKRNLARLLWSIPMFGTLSMFLDLILILTGERQRIGDRYAQTVVISTDSYGPYTPQGYGPGGYPPPGSPPPGYPPYDYPPPGYDQPPPPGYNGYNQSHYRQNGSAPYLPPPPYDPSQGQHLQNGYPDHRKPPPHQEKGGSYDAGAHPGPMATEYKPQRDREGIRELKDQIVREGTPPEGRYRRGRDDYHATDRGPGSPYATQYRPGEGTGKGLENSGNGPGSGSRDRRRWPPPPEE